MKAEVTIRQGRASDHAFVRDSFWRTYIDSPYASGASPSLLDGLLTPFLESWKLSVVCSTHATDEIIGFMIWQHPRAIAWVHTKRGYRKRGVAKALLKHAGVVAGTPVEPCPISAPFLTTRIAEPEGADAADFLKLLRAKGFNVRFRPYLGMATQLDRKAA